MPAKVGFQTLVALRDRMLDLMALAVASLDCADEAGDSSLTERARVLLVGPVGDALAVELVLTTLDRCCLLSWLFEVLAAD